MLNIEKYKNEILKECAEEKLYPSYPRGITVIKFANAAHDVFDKHSEKECEDFEHLLEWLLAEYEEPILTEKEKKYLSTIIKPFKNQVKTIKKYRPLATAVCIITIKVEVEPDYNVFVKLPPFERSNGMYQGMEENKEYTIEELGL